MGMSPRAIQQAGLFFHLSPLVLSPFKTNFYAQGRETKQNGSYVSKVKGLCIVMVWTQSVMVWLG